MITQQILGLVADITAIGGIPIAGWQLYKGRKEQIKTREEHRKEELRKNEAIKIQLLEKSGKRKITLPNTVRRGELTRAEVLGRMGMIPMLPDPDNLKIKQRRFEVKKNATEEFIRNIDHLFVSSEGDKLIINCDTQEMDQFDITEIKKLGFNVSGFDE